jgi:alpha-tubulin suppressor-like RCC1 family protein
MAGMGGQTRYRTRPGRLGICLKMLVLAGATALGAGTTSCNPADRRIIISDKNTNWLNRCHADLDCGGHLRCLHGMCSSLCKNDSECSVHGAAARCTTSRGGGACADPSEGPVQVCSVACASDDVCRGRGLVCADHACVRETCSAEAGPGPSDARAPGATVPPGAMDAYSATPMGADGGAPSGRDTGARDAAATAPQPPIGDPVTGGLPEAGLRAVELSAGASHTCALLSDGTVRCWGGNEIGQLGTGSLAGPDTCVVTADALMLPCSLKPVKVVGLTDAVAIAAGAETTCALRANGTVECWGGNTFGELGNGTTMPALLPSLIPGLSGVHALSLVDYVACAVLSDGTVRCWGENLYGQTGNGDANGPDECVNKAIPSMPVYESCAETPTVVQGLTGAAVAATGQFHTCVLMRDGSVQCWGMNSFGQLGDGRNQEAHTCASGASANPCAVAPVRVLGLINAAAVTVGSLHSCALLGDGTVSCWGESGALGVVVETDCLNPGACATTPVAVPGLANVVTISAGDFYTCALLADGSVRCWGMNSSGSLGSGTTENSIAPVRVANVADAKAISSNDFHTCVLLGNGGVACWGQNEYGQLGDGTTSESAVAVAVQW